MAVDIIIPSVGESVTSGVLSRWVSSHGAAVKKDDVVAELETDKVTLEIRAPEAGQLNIVAKQGSTVNIGEVIGSIAVGAGAVASSAPAPAVALAAKPEPSAVGASSGNESHTNGKARATPLAEKLATEHGIDLSRFSGSASGIGGRISEQDVMAAINAKPAASPAPATKPSPVAQASSSSSSRGVTREPMSPLRQRIASRLVQAQHTAAMLTTFNECDMSAIMDIRKSYKDEFEKKNGIGLGFMSFFVKAVVGALKAFPLVNASIVEDTNGQLFVEKHDFYDVAIAVGTPKGLVVPVLRNCDQLSFAQIESGIKDLALRARDGKLTLDEMQGGTFTITNGGIYGSLMSTPILNAPQSGILGMHSIKNRPMEYPIGSGQVAIRPMMYLALSYDHRIVDGAEAVQFLVRIKNGIEDPQRLLLGV